jgi:crotonobetainyl-CoA:carnitine CoA-transferase CaiB-like acyl-CoA transferase
MDGIVLEWLLERTKQQAAEQMQAAGIAVTPINSPEDAVLDRHFRERGFWIEIDHPVTGRLTYPGAPVDMSDGGFKVRMPAPLLGEHNSEVYGQLGYTGKDLAALSEAGDI